MPDRAAVRSAAASPAVFGGVLAYCMAMATLAQFAVGALAPFLTVDLGLTRSQIGGLTTAMFVAGAACSPPLGRLVDAIGARRMIGALFAVAAMAFAAMAAAPGYPWLLGAFALAGVSMAASNPATNRLIAHHAPPGPRGLLVGVKQSGVQAGGFVAGAALPPVAALVGWRGSLVLAAALAVAGLVLTGLTLPKDPPTSPRVPRGDRPPLDPVVGLLGTYALFMGAGIACVGAFLPLYATDVLGLNATTAGQVVALLGFVGVVARIGWARAADGGITFPTALGVMAATAVLSTGLVVAAGVAGVWLLWLAAVALGGTASAWNGVGMLAIIAEVDPAQSGRASGMVLLAFYVGFVVSPVAFGAAVDATGRYDLAWAGVAASFAIAAGTVARWRRTRHR